MPPQNKAPMRINVLADVEGQRMDNEAILDKQDRRNLPKASAPDGMIPFDLADDIASKIQDELEDNEEWGATLVSAAMASPEFKKKVVSKLAEELA